MWFSPVRYRAALSGLLVAAGVILPAMSASSIQMQQNEHSSLEKQCGATSPRLVAMGDSYFDLGAHSRKISGFDISEPLSRDELLAALQPGRYESGEGRRTKCFGTGNSLEPRTTSVTLQDISSKTHTESHSGHDSDKARAVVITAYEYDVERRVSRREAMVVPLSAIAVDTFSGLLISSRYRQRQITPQGSYLRETELTALQTEDELILEQNVFVNGALAQWTTWQVSY